MSMVLYAYSPPYESPIELNGSLPTGLARGTVLLLRPTGQVATATVGAEVETLQRHLPRQTLALWLDLVDRYKAAEIVAGAALQAVRAYIVRALVDCSALRRQLTEAGHISYGIQYRLRLYGFDVRPLIMELISTVCTHAAECRSLQDAIRRSGLDYDRVWREVRDGGLGSPAKLYHLLRLLRIAITLQRDPGTRVADISHRHGFYAPTALRARFNDVFGTPPSIVRTWLGWEELLYLGLKRAGMVRPAQRL